MTTEPSVVLLARSLRACDPMRLWHSLVCMPPTTPTPLHWHTVIPERLAHSWTLSWQRSLGRCASGGSMGRCWSEQRKLGLLLQTNPLIRLCALRGGGERARTGGWVRGCSGRGASLANGLPPNICQRLGKAGLGHESKQQNHKSTSPCILSKSHLYLCVCLFLCRHVSVSRNLQED